MCIGQFESNFLVDDDTEKETKLKSISHNLFEQNEYFSFKV